MKHFDLSAIMRRAWRIFRKDGGHADEHARSQQQG